MPKHTAIPANEEVSAPDAQVDAGPAPEGEAPAEGVVRPHNKVLLLKDYCVRAQGAVCNRCEIACPHAAITFAPHDADAGLPIIDAEACSRCGICFGICDAFSSTRVTMLDLHARIRRIALTGDRVYITCKENIFPGFTPAHNVVVVPCLAALAPEFWTLLLAENIDLVIACDLAYCAECEVATALAETLYAHAIQSAEGWTGKTIGFASEIPEKRKLIEEYTDERGFDRRSAFTKTLGDVGDIASGKRRLRNSEVLQDFFERREKNKAIANLNLAETDVLSDFLPGGRTRKMLFPKRRMLLEALQRSPEIAESIPVYLSTTNTQRCTRAYSCVDTCPTGARQIGEDGAIELDKRFCIGCGICVDACAAGACDVMETSAAELLDALEKSLLGESGAEGGAV
ncbi:MAG: 4Fe-4S ferredoxin [Raoultibacter sp.]